MSYRELWKRDWIATFERVWSEIVLDDCLGASAQLAYYFFLAFFPFIVFLAVLATLAASIPIDDVETWTRSLLWQLMPQQAFNVVDDTVTVTLRILRHSRLRLLAASMVLSLWSASNGMRAVMVTLNRAWNVREGRSLWQRYVLSITLTVSLALTLVVALPLWSFSGKVGGWIGHTAGPGWATLWTLTSRAFAVAVLIFVLEVIYHFAPNARRPWHWITPGSILAVVLWLVAVWFFSYYVTRFGRYEKIYASLGAPVVLLLWFYIAGLAILVGGETNAEIERSSGLKARMTVPAPRGVDAAGHDMSQRVRLAAATEDTPEAQPGGGVETRRRLS